MSEAVNDAALGARIAGKVQLRLTLPLVFLMFLSSLDRSNVSFAALQMNQEIGLTPQLYGLAASLFFLGFLPGQYPSVVLLQRIGVKGWVTLMVGVWAAVEIAMAYVTSPGMFFVLRVILGLAEGGMAPGIVVFLTRWAPPGRRANTFAMPMLAIPFSLVLGGPLCGWLMEAANPLGLAGWRWMFLALGVGNAVIAVIAGAWFPNGPDDAKWLSDTEKTWINANVSAAPPPPKRGEGAMGEIFREPLFWIFALIWFLLLGGAYAIMFWLPQVLRQLTGMSPLEIGLITALPWIGNGLALVINSWHSDKTGERFWHLSIPMVVAALAFGAASLAPPGVAGLIFLVIGASALGAAQGTFWAVPAAAMPPKAMTGGIAFINISGSAAGLVIPNLIAPLRDATGAFAAPIWMICGMLTLSALLTMAARARAMSVRPA